MKILNPHTNRLINIGGRTYKKLIKEGYTYDDLIDYTNEPKPIFLKPSINALQLLNVIEMLNSHLSPEDMYMLYISDKNLQTEIDTLYKKNENIYFIPWLKENLNNEQLHADKNNEEAIALRDWIIFRNQNYLYKIKVIQAINKWNDTRKNIIKKLLTSVLNLNTVNAWQQIKNIYSNLIPSISRKIITSDGIYTKWKLIKSTNCSNIYETLLNNVIIIVKAYINVERNIYAENENKISNELYIKGFYVPKRYQSFITEHFLCIPMQKLDTTLLEMYINNEIITLLKIKNIVNHFIPILEILHKEYKKLYVDFSCGNVGFYKNESYMIDFGALHEPQICTPIIKTLRYSSINSDNEKSIIYKDDLQSLGFVIVETILGPYTDVFNNKQQLIFDCKEGKYGDFLQDYFNIIEKKDPYNLLINLSK